MLAHCATSMLIALQLSWRNPENVDEMYVKRHNADVYRRSDRGVRWRLQAETNYNNLLCQLGSEVEISFHIKISIFRCRKIF